MKNIGELEKLDNVEYKKKQSILIDDEVQLELIGRQ